MPVYEYECFSCGTHFDRRQRFDEEPVGLCPSCQGKARRVIHCVPVIFKGSGFYVTDSRKETNSQPSHKRLEGQKPEEAKKPEEKKPEPVSASGQKDTEH
jgi:putative FmdB family regulatory protein